LEDLMIGKKEGTEDRCQKLEVRPARNALATPGIAKLSRGGRASEAGEGPGMNERTELTFVLRE
jgi:hypothetical protein